jgi:hypothetical protein
VQLSLPVIAKRPRWEAFLGETKRAAAAADWSRCGDMHAALGAQDGDVFIASCERLIPLLRRHIARAEALLCSVGPVVCGHPLSCCLDELR